MSEVHKPQHRRRFGRATVLAAVLLAALGFSLVVQVRQTSTGGYASLSQSDLVQILGTVNEKSAQVDRETQELQQQEQELRTGTDQAQAVETQVRKRLTDLQILAGTVPATGPGIVLRIDDPDGNVRANAVLNAVQELRDAGAEAMQIGTAVGAAPSAAGSSATAGATPVPATTGAVRIVASTAFTDPEAVGQDGVEVSGTRVRPAYLITAIGSPETMDSALKIPGGVMDSLDQVGAHGSVLRSERLTISATRAAG
ncbi:DUF881 domain-containing protein [Spongisporangium articulatum]|uniref:DUF881 domain-containing protein n=1 Tax=Spongisporangium articulatum TaxID=3362603 RepID=A0ABW8ASA4_9ACTN